MKDRIPYPGQAGRVLIKYEDGTEEYAILEMADNPSEPGMELKKVNLLTDDTAALIGLDPTDDPTPNDALNALHTESNSAAGVARAIAFDSNVNDDAMRSALGEFTPYADTHGLGYALYMYGITDAGLDKETASTVRDALMLCKDRQQIAASADAIDALGKLPKSRELWRKYVFTVKGKTTEIVTDYGYEGLRHNPVNSYLYGLKATSSSGSSTYWHVSWDNGATWGLVTEDGSPTSYNSKFKIAFSSDYKYTYMIYTSGDKNTVAYSTDGIDFSSSEFKLSAWTLADAVVYDNIFMHKAADDRYYYMTWGSDERTLARVYTYVCDGKSAGEIADSSPSQSWTGGYCESGVVMPISNGLMYAYNERAQSGYTGGEEAVHIGTCVYKDGTDTGSYTRTMIAEADADYPADDFDIHLQQLEDGTIYTKLRAGTRNNGDVTVYYKVTQSGEITELDDTTEFPAMQDGDYGLVYALPQGQAYIPYISSYTGKLVKDNWGAVADGTQVMPTFGTDQREYFKDDKVTIVYSSDGVLTVTGFNDEEAV